jgi:hypothetical protein
MITLNKAFDLSTQEINEKLKDLCITLKQCTTRDAEWGDLIDDYLILKSVLHSRCQAKKIEEFEAYYDKYLAGKTFEEIHPDYWICYAKLHKNLFGYLPEASDRGLMYS